eukprot:g41055.t1
MHGNGVYKHKIHCGSRILDLDIPEGDWRSWQAPVTNHRAEAGIGKQSRSGGRHGESIPRTDTGVGNQVPERRPVRGNRCRRKFTLEQMRANLYLGVGNVDTFLRKFVVRVVDEVADLLAKMMCLIAD